MTAPILDAVAPNTVLNHFGRLARKVNGWSDHCRECAMCYSASIDRGGKMLQLAERGTLVGFEVVR